MIVLYPQYEPLHDALQRSRDEMNRGAYTIDIAHVSAVSEEYHQMRGKYILATESSYQETSTIDYE
jgi:hypothetical protein